MNRISLTHFSMLVLAAGAFAAHTPAHGQPQTGGQGGGKESSGGQNGERRGPPAEAIAACKALKLDQACTFTSPRGAESGSCFQPDSNHPLACRPDRNKSGGPQGAGGSKEVPGKAGATTAQGDKSGDKSSGERHHPPAEALAACNSRKLNDACAFTSPRGAETGTCFQPDASKLLACRPVRN